MGKNFPVQKLLLPHVQSGCLWVHPIRVISLTFCIIRVAPNHIAPAFKAYNLLAAFCLLTGSLSEGFRLSGAKNPRFC